MGYTNTVHVTFLFSIDSRLKFDFKSYDMEIHFAKTNLVLFNTSNYEIQLQTAPEKDEMSYTCRSGVMGTPFW